MGAFSRSNRQLPSRSQATRKGPVRLHSAPRWPAPARALRASAPPRHSRPRAPVEFRYRNRLWTGRPHRWGRNIPCSHATTCRPCRRSAGRRSWRSTRAATWQSGTGRCRHRTHVETAVLADGGGRRVIEIRRALRWQLHRDTSITWRGLAGSSETSTAGASCFSTPLVERREAEPCAAGACSSSTAGVGMPSYGQRFFLTLQA